MRSAFSYSIDAAAEDSDAFDNDILSALHTKSAPAFKDPTSHLETWNRRVETPSEELLFKRSPSAKPKQTLQGPTHQKIAPASQQAPDLSQLPRTSSTPKPTLFSKPPSSQNRLQSGSVALHPPSSTSIQDKVSSADSSSLPPRLRPAVLLGGSVRSGPSSNMKTSLFSVPSTRHPSPPKSQPAVSQSSDNIPIRHPLLMSNQNVLAPGPVPIPSSMSASKPLFRGPISSSTPLQSPFTDHHPTNKNTSWFSSHATQREKPTSGSKATPIHATTVTARSTKHPQSVNRPDRRTRDNNSTCNKPDSRLATAA
ncbi:hypothetical protein EV421DRAFT_873678 [Armillaria borealis]|uniref:Uncharacterized protein n=1 Tax=Armillaria borealis TaxID=47425 RepID=A0AA39JAG7_9AGAR|nr:hypothetical protein EV421DRAFT_873678 [Armillaria borealis]